MENIQQPTPMNLQIEFGLINFKLQILNLAKELVKDKLVDEDIKDTYLDLREEILGVPNPKNQKENGTNS